MRRDRRAFTLIELLITITIIGIMASMVLFALYRAQETAKAHKTRALIAKLDAVIKDKWQTYQYRRVPVELGGDRYEDTDGSGGYSPGDNLLSDWNGNSSYDTAAADPRSAAKIRLESIRDLMRMEMPDRYTDLVDVLANGSVTGTRVNNCAFAMPSPSLPAVRVPSLYNTYCLRMAAAAPSIENQGAEMLYLIVMQSLASDEDSRDVFKPGNIGDTDDGGKGDGMPEFIDGWGRPIKFIRWPAGMISDLQIVARVVVTNVNGNAITASGPGLSSASGAYVGGAIGVIEAAPPSPNQAVSPKPINGKRMARITGYSAGTFTVAGATSGQPFNGQPPGNGDTVVILPPDPFDPTDVQRNPLSDPAWGYYAANQYVPSFATYPLIYSAGPDGQFGILADIDTSTVAPYSYEGNESNPYVAHPLTGDPMDPFAMMFGASSKLTVNGTAERENASLDNIHNHLQGLR